MYYALVWGVGVTLGMALPVIAGYGREGVLTLYPALFGMAFFASIFITPFGQVVILHLFHSESIQEGWLLTEAAPIAFGSLFGLLGRLG